MKVFSNISIDNVKKVRSSVFKSGINQSFVAAKSSGQLNSAFTSRAAIEALNLSQAASSLLNRALVISANLRSQAMQFFQGNHPQPQEIQDQYLQMTNYVEQSSALYGLPEISFYINKSPVGLRVKDGLLAIEDALKQEKMISEQTADSLTEVVEQSQFLTKKIEESFEVKQKEIRSEEQAGELQAQIIEDLKSQPKEMLMIQGNLHANNVRTFLG